jgi:hypothetical protein
VVFLGVLQQVFSGFSPSVFAVLHGLGLLCCLAHPRVMAVVPLGHIDVMSIII